MTLIVWFLFNLANAQEYLQPQEEHYLCKYISSYSKTMVTHGFKTYSFGPITCEYYIKVNDKVILESKAYSQDCEEFMRKQIQKGSVCLTNVIF